MKRARTKLRVALLGNFSAAYRAGQMVQALTNRAPAFVVTCRDPSWYPFVSGRLQTASYLFWSLRALLFADVIVFLPMFRLGRAFWILLRLARLLRKRVIVDFYISLFESAILEKRLRSPESPTARAYVRSDRVALRSGDPVLFLSDAERKYYASLLSVPERMVRHHTLRLVVPERPAARLPYAIGITTTPCVAWWGRLGNPLHGVDTLLESLEIVQTRYGRELRVLLFPSGTEAEVEHFIRAAKGVPNCEIDQDSTMANGRLIAILREQVDIAFGAFGGTPKARVVPLNKVIDAMSVGVPCVTGISAALQEDVAPGTLHFVEHSDAEAIASAIQVLVANQEELKRLGQASRLEWRRLYSPEVFERSFIAAVEQRN